MKSKPQVGTLKLLSQFIVGFKKKSGNDLI